MADILDPLPESSDEYWEHSDKNTELPWQSKQEAAREARENLNKHYFEKVKGNEVQCNHCDWGFALDPGDEVDNGHVYDRNKKLVI